MEIDVKHIAQLAKLKIPEEEVPAMKAEMTSIIHMVEDLPPLSDEGALIDPDDRMELREDVVVPSYPRDEMLQNVPKAVAGCIVVPKSM